MKFYLAIPAVVVFAVGIIVTPAISATPGEVEVGSVLRDARMFGIGGKTRNLSEYRGKPLIINVWASWCGPCRLEMGSLNRLSKLDRKQQFRVIGISTDDDAIAATEYVMKSKLAFENFVDDNLRLENMLGANTIPLTLLVDANGRVLQKIRGARDWASPEAVAAVERAFAIRVQR